jgi:cell division protease FtsH
MKNWFLKNQQKITRISVVASIVTLVVLQSITLPTAKVTLKEPLTVAQQVYSVAGQNTAVQALTKAQIKDMSGGKDLGLVPVKIVNSTEMLNTISNENNKISDAHFNTATRFTAAAVTSGRATTIVGAYYLPEQQPTLMASYEAVNAPITAINFPVSTTQGSTSTGYMRGPVASNPGYPASTVNLGTVSGQYQAAANSTATNTTANVGLSGWETARLLVSLALYGFLFVVFIRWLMRRFKGLSGAARSAKLEQAAGVPETRFTDVAGVDEAIEDMRELVEFLKTPERFTKTGATPPRGALLVGPPGTGKTLLARAVAGEAGVPFYSAAGSDFVEMYVGVGARRVRDLFTKAKAHPEGAIIFIDEIDSVGRARQSRSEGAGNQEQEGTLNALLVEMDGFSKSNVIVLAATNRDDMLDPALVRPGRLDRKIQVPLPDRSGRERILQVHAGDRPFTEDVNWDLIARRTPGMSGADLAQLINEASLIAAREDRDSITNSDLDAAVATVAMGKPRLSAVVTPHDRNITAWHEGGHTVCAMVLPDADEPVSVSIIPRGPAGGVTWMAQGDDLFLTRKRAFARLVVAMGGRAAEEILLDGEFTSGPHGDLTAATDTALAMVTQYGMTDLGLMIRSQGWLSTGAKMTDETVEAVEKLLAEALETARATLRDHRDLLDRVVEGLLENDTLIQSELVALQVGVVTTAPELPPAPRNYVRQPASQETAPVAPPRSTERKPVARRRSLVGALAVAFQAAADAWESAPTRKRRRKR